MMRSGPLSVLAAILTAVPAFPAIACSPIGYERSGSPPALERNEARSLLDKAARVDLVIADSSRPFDLDTALLAVPENLNPAQSAAVQPELDVWRARGGIVAFRVLETFKGPPQAGFDMAAAVALDTVTGHAQRAYWAGRRRAFDDPDTYWSSWVDPFDTSRLFDSCWQPIHVVIGGTYLIFRDETGNILGPTLPFRWRHSGQVFQVQGPVFEEVFGGDDPWLRREASQQTPS
ncbi:MAG: hypothetical protein EBR82_01645 [Caulobacteraceae bacterium]|nr:hypothetical protein [Caulobacteraceae bacterium]